MAHARRAGSIVGGFLVLSVAASCSSEAPTRVPEGQGWVVTSSRSEDLEFDFATGRITAGFVVVMLADGSEFQVDESTQMLGHCQELVPPPWMSAPCWLQVGGIDGEGVAQWVTAFGPVGDTGLPETWNQEHDRYYAVDMIGRLRAVTSAGLEFTNGTVVRLGEGAPEIIHCDETDRIEMLVGQSILVHLDVDTGEATTVECVRQV